MKHLLQYAEKHIAIIISLIFCSPQHAHVHTQFSERERFVEVDSLKYFTQACINLYQAKNNFDAIHWMRKQELQHSWDQLNVC